MSTMEILYDNIDAERARNHLTLAQFAESIGMSDRCYRQHREHLKPLKIDKLVKIADVFNCSIDYLTGRTDKIRMEDK